MSSRAPDDDPDLLEREFPLGDGTAEMAATVICPCCGEPVEIALDPGSGGAQLYEEDCAVCCQPWQVRVRYRRDGTAEVRVAGLEG
jgi:Cysteine-rich CPXCG